MRAVIMGDWDSEGREGNRLGEQGWQLQVLRNTELYMLTFVIVNGLDSCESKRIEKYNENS